MSAIAGLLMAAVAVATITPSVSGPSSTRELCSPAVSGSRNTFVIKCEIDRSHGLLALTLLNRVLAKQLDPKIVMAKLDEILKASSRPNQTISAPGGIAAMNGNLYNPTVNNYGPPLAHLEFSEADDTAPSDARFTRPGYQFRKVTITTDRPIPGALIGVIFNGEAELSDTKGNLPDPTLEGSGATQLNWGGKLTKNGEVIPFSYYFSINIPSSFLPGMKLIIPYRAKPGVYVLEALPIGG